MFVLGITGTGHCVGMCGPLVLALPAHSGRYLAHLLYHLGRVCTYTLVGAAVGGAGAAMATAAGVAGNRVDWVPKVQVTVALLAAALLLGLGLLRLGVVREPAWMAVASPARIPGFRRLQRSAMARGGLGSLFLLGLMLGLLPCGLSYAAFVRALPAGGPLPGALLLAGFGAGTIPGLLVVGTAASAFARRHARLFDLLSGLLLIAMAASLAVDAAGALL
jgi:sulfite exporter TauE/SafE